ncbi:NIPSNAP family protein [Novosphingobium panipatense]
MIQITWKAADHEHYNQVRFAFVTDPAWREFASKAGKLWRSGTRRFFYPSPIEMEA